MKRGTGSLSLFVYYTIGLDTDVRLYNFQEEAFIAKRHEAGYRVPVCMYVVANVTRGR